MRNPSSNGTGIGTLLKMLGAALKSIFQSSSNRDFKRLKDFIAS